ncbi:MAG TPA: dTDP-4-dehydrorhamnose reductase [Steroidobacteraceae bacterium]
MKVLITGASGQLGRALAASVPPQVELLALARTRLDIRDASAVRAAVSAFRPALVINAAAYTAVDKAESEPELASAVNADGPRALAQALLDLPGSRLVHVSTDYVFDGSASEPYRPSDAPHPLGVYGRTKWLGERAVLESLGERAVVVRTAWLYAAQGSNFLLTMLRLMRERGAVRVVADQYGTPTAAGSVARALWVIAQRPALHGILHWTDEGRASWYDFAVAIAEEGLAAGLLPAPAKVSAISTAEFPTAARRPASSLLDLRESMALLGISPQRWRDSLRATLAHLQTASPALAKRGP